MRMNDATAKRVEVRIDVLMNDVRMMKKHSIGLGAGLDTTGKRLEGRFGGGRLITVFVASEQQLQALQPQSFGSGAYE